MVVAECGKKGKEIHFLFLSGFYFFNGLKGVFAFFSLDGKEAKGQICTAKIMNYELELELLLVMFFYCPFVLTQKDEKVKANAEG